MSGWTHAMCDECWWEQHGFEEPCVLIKRHAELCGWCGKLTRSGIYVRADPKDVPLLRGDFFDAEPP